jgi:predicted ATPase
MTGRAANGIAELRQCLAAHAGMQSRLVVPYIHSLLAESLSVSGDADAALAVIDDGLSMAAATLQAFHEIELNRLRGELLLTRGNASQEESARYLRRAIELAHQQEARSYELRAAIALARVMKGAGRESDARAALAPIHESFTEGHETPDLQAAARLLGSLIG